jgi:hypothetical protein
MMPHRAEYKGQFLAVVPDIVRLRRDLRHQDDAGGGIGPLQTADVKRQLIAKDKDENGLLLHRG